MVEKLGNDELVYKMAKLDKRFKTNKQLYIDKYSVTNDTTGLNDKGMRKFDKSAKKYARGVTKNFSKQIKTSKRRLYAPYEIDPQLGTLVERYNPLLTNRR